MTAKELNDLSSVKQYLWITGAMDEMIQAGVLDSEGNIKGDYSLAFETQEEFSLKSESERPCTLYFRLKGKYFTALWIKHTV